MKGKMVGSGLAYALAADVRFGDPTLSISSGANRMGLGGADIGLGWLLPRLCGWSATSEILLSFRWIEAERLLRTGLISEIVPTDKLEDAGRKMAKDMLELSHMVRERSERAGFPDANRRRDSSNLYLLSTLFSHAYFVR